MLKDIRNDVKRDIKLRRRALNIIPCVLLRGESVVFRAYGVKFCRNIKSARTLICTLEHHMLQEMRDAIYLLSFVTRTGADKHKHSHRLRACHRNHEQAQTVWINKSLVH